jgi:hypothetical protein
MPNLEGRKARCSYHGEVDSDVNLAFFEYRGEGSFLGLHQCGNCRYYDIAHENHLNYHGNRTTCKCTDFVPIGSYEYDSYYCGCRGWE